MQWNAYIYWIFLLHNIIIKKNLGAPLTKLFVAGALFFMLSAGSCAKRNILAFGALISSLVFFQAFKFQVAMLASFSL